MDFLKWHSACHSRMELRNKLARLLDSSNEMLILEKSPGSFQSKTTTHGNHHHLPVMELRDLPRCDVDEASLSEEHAGIRMISIFQCWPRNITLLDHLPLRPSCEADWDMIR